MDRAGIEAIRRASTSSLLIVLVQPGTPDPEFDAIAAEIDRRIPVPDPRIGKPLKVPGWDRPVRVVAVEPSGALRVRRDDEGPEALDRRVDPARIAPGDWVDG